MSNNNTYKRPVIVWGNSFYINISLERYIEGTYEDFDLTKVTDLKVYLICATHNTEIPLTYEIVDGFNNVLKCFVDYRLLHTTSYGIVVEGNDEKEMHFRFSMLPKEGFLVVNNTSGMNITDDVQVIDISGRCGWGISTGTDLTNYYTKITIDNLLNEKADKSSLAKVATSGDYNDLTNKPVVKEQVQSDWNENDKTKPDYIKNKPDLSQYIKEQDLNNYYDKAEVDVMLNNKADTSTLNSDYYSKNEVNNLLNEKVDTSDLSQVAISGDYNELTNKPDLSQYATKEELSTKQDTLISGENIKTINGNSILGSGNIEIQGGSGGSSYTAGNNINITDNTISTTNDLDVTTIKTEDIKIKKTENARVNYMRWPDTPNRYLAGGALLYNELRIGEEWYTHKNALITFDTQNNGLLSLSFDEWTYTEDYPSWIVGADSYPVYKTGNQVNGQPVYGVYNPDSGSPDFYVYDADNYGINSIYVDYNDVTVYNPISYWRMKDGGMFINKDGNDTNNSFGGERQVSIGENNNFGSSENKLMVGDNLEGEYQGNQLLVGYHNRKKNALFTVGNGEYSTSFYPYEKTINNEHSFTIWTGLTDEAFTNNSHWLFTVNIINTDDTQLFGFNDWMNPLTDIESYPYSYNLEATNGVDGSTYYAIVTLQRDNNNLGITFDLYTDEQHTSTYNIFDPVSSRIADDVYLLFDMPYKRDAFFVTSDGNVYIPYFQDRNNTYNLGEAVYNLEQRPQPVQSNWNEGDESSLAYIQNKPDLNQYATKEEVNGKQDTLVSGSNIKTINGQDILGSGDIVISGGDKPYEKQYLTFEALEDGTFSFTQNDLQYSLDDGVTWQTLTAGTSTPTISAGNKILWKQTGLVTASDKLIGTFSSTGKFNIYGNIMSLYYGDDFIGQKDLTGKDYAFCYLLGECSNLINTENLILPATTLADYCYAQMFSGCESLLKVPELPATTLADNCYGNMFQGCTSLTKAPELPATTLADSCYYEMFWNCASLTKAPELPATTLVYSCYTEMFGYCSSLTKAPELPAIYLGPYCYDGMFYECASLTKATELPATTLQNGCYRNMFQGCTSLTTAPELKATTLANECYYHMFGNCTSLTKAPELPAKTLAESCYNTMFIGCQKINYVKCLATDISATDCLTDWIDGTMPVGTFITAENKPAYESGTSGIPSGWNVYTESQYEEVRHYELANKVSSSTNGLKIEVLNALPEAPAENTIYVIV